MWYNSIMSALLRSPFHGMLSSQMLLIKVTGRKSGRQYTTPVNYFQQDDFNRQIYFSRWHRNCHSNDTSHISRVESEREKEWK